MCIRDSLDSRKQAIESMLKPVSESLKLVQSRLGEMEKELSLIHI